MRQRHRDLGEFKVYLKNNTHTHTNPKVNQSLAWLLSAGITAMGHLTRSHLVLFRYCFTHPKATWSAVETVLFLSLGSYPLRLAL